MFKQYKVSEELGSTDMDTDSGTDLDMDKGQGICKI